MGCAPIIVGAGMGATAIISEDRRTSGAMIEDKSIERKTATLVRKNIGESSTIRIFSFNRFVLLVGQVQSEIEKNLAEDLAFEIQNVRDVQNELEVAGNSASLSKRSDNLVKAGVLSNFVKEKKVKSNYHKVVVESGIVFIMGLVTQAEGLLAAEVASGTKGVKKVVKVYEYLD